MVWLAKWIREHVTDARVLIITDRTELDEQIEKVFKGVNEDIYRTKSGADLIATLNATKPWLLCSLIHKFGGKEDGEEVGDIAGFIEEMKKALPPDFKAKGDLFVFVDECHRTQSGDLHEAMKAILPNAHVHRLHRHAAAEGGQAEEHRGLRPLHPHLQVRRGGAATAWCWICATRRGTSTRASPSQEKIDQWFEAKTKGLTDLAKAQLKQRWGTMQKVLSSQSGWRRSSPTS